jgi:hypothetical protein
MASIETHVPVKRGPGRPSRKPTSPAIAKFGIVNEPEDEENDMELVYDSPQAFKALFTYLKSLKTRTVILSFDPDGIVIYAKDHSEKSITVAYINGNKMNWFYCGDVFCLEFNRDLVDRMFTNVDKTFYKVSVLRNRSDTSALTFMFRDAEIGKDCVYRIPVDVCAQIPEQYVIAEEVVMQPDKFPLEFTLTVKQFEKTIADTISQSPVITIMKSDQCPLEITYTKQRTVYREVYEDDSKIEVVCRLDPGYHFQTHIKLVNIKPLVASMVTEKVRICCGDDGQLLFRLVVRDEAIVVNSLTATGDV